MAHVLKQKIKLLSSLPPKEGTKYAVKKAFLGHLMSDFNLNSSEMHSVLSSCLFPICVLGHLSCFNSQHFREKFLFVFIQGDFFHSSKKLKYGKPWLSESMLT